ncbi:nuclear transport factor 2 family protein [Hyphobacterium sp. SN044]|uniref:nuclear transport factor 2 family protein n=1 Tax=Hyphobacterium sp. SN044 TaxID=2912575 RepID=UPI001F42D422|nr:nuclear transport factor 2 family protein [Hyphobacterium sp. SN044]MCF8880498.1 nuclear transport factor 2 family protein [Hyphobacterium sp. SN044]
MIRTLTAAAVLTFTGAAAQAQDAPEAVAEAYLAAYQAQDFVALEALYAEDAVFIDPTSEAIQGIGGPFNWTGREAILAGIRGWGATRLEYEIDRTWSASGHVVFGGAVAAIYETETGSVAYRYPIITIVTIEDGHVTEHRDYTDFSGMTQEAR